MFIPEKQIVVVPEKTQVIPGMTSICHISDLHLREADVQGIDFSDDKCELPRPLGLFESKLREQVNHGMCDLLVVTGDLIEGEMLGPSSRTKCFQK